MNVVLQIFTLLGALAMFLYGMTLMSESLQKVAGDGLRNFLASMTSNPFKRVLTGLFITAIIQSSSATTVMVVSFVNAGLLSLMQAVGVIMGANIGTTVTAWLVSLLGFKSDISILSIPLMAVGFVLMMAKSTKRKNVGLMIIGFSLLFLGLSFMKDSVPNLSDHPQVLAFIQEWTGWGVWSVLIFLGIGTLLTIVLQSSSATMALTLVMVNFGWIPFEMAAAMVLGENIGTTITANIAASVGNVSAKRAALAHTLFNVFGVLWCVCLFRPFLRLVAWVITGIGCADPFIPISQAADPQWASTSMLYSVAMVHTLFNITNTLLLVWFTPLIVKTVTKIVKSPKEEEKFRLKFIQAGMMSTAELSLGQAKQEIVHFGKIVKQHYVYARQAIEKADTQDFEALAKKLEYYEQVADRVEFEIAEYLTKISEGEISAESGKRIQAMYKIIGELESMGDSGFNIGRILQRKNINNKKFDERLVKNLLMMSSLVEVAIDAMLVNLEKGYTKLVNIDNAEDAETDINECRNELREAHLLSLENNDYSYLTGVYYMDLVVEYERVGDFIINISEAIMEIKD